MQANPCPLVHSGPRGGVGEDKDETSFSRAVFPYQHLPSPSHENSVDLGGGVVARVPVDLNGGKSVIIISV